MRQNLIFLLMITAIFPACKKEIKPSSCETIVKQNYTYDTVKPSDYLMVYPGSWWTFTNGTDTYTDSCNSWESVSIAQVSVNGNCKTILEDMLVMPYSSYGYISFESEVISSPETLFYPNLRQTEFIPLISETPGEIYNVKKINSGGYYSRTVTSYGEIDSMTIGSTVFYDIVRMRQKHVTYYSGANGGPVFETEYYYSKGVGIIRKLKWFTQAGIPLDTADLVNYYIAPH